MSMDIGDLGAEYLAVRAEAEDARVVLYVAGELDIATVPLLKRHLDDMHTAGVREIVFDLHEMSFMGSTGLSLVLAAQARATAAGQRLLLRRVPSQARRLFELAGVTTLLSIVD